MRKWASVPVAAMCRGSEYRLGKQHTVSPVCGTEYVTSVKREQTLQVRQSCWGFRSNASRQAFRTVLDIK